MTYPSFTETCEARGFLERHDLDEGLEESLADMLAEQRERAVREAKWERKAILFLAGFGTAAVFFITIVLLSIRFGPPPGA